MPICSIGDERDGVQVVVGAVFTVEDAAVIAGASLRAPERRLTIDLRRTRTFYAPALSALSRLIGECRETPVLLGVGGPRARLLSYLPARVLAEDVEEQAAVKRSVRDVVRTL